MSPNLPKFLQSVAKPLLAPYLTSPPSISFVQHCVTILDGSSPNIDPLNPNLSTFYHQPNLASPPSDHKSPEAGVFVGKLYHTTLSRTTK